MVVADRVLRMPARARVAVSLIRFVTPSGRVWPIDHHGVVKKVWSSFAATVMGAPLVNSTLNIKYITLFRMYEKVKYGCRNDFIQGLPQWF